MSFSQAGINLPENTNILQIIYWISWERIVSKNIEVPKILLPAAKTDEPEGLFYTDDYFKSLHPYCICLSPQPA